MRQEKAAEGLQSMKASLSPGAIMQEKPPYPHHPDLKFVTVEQSHITHSQTRNSNAEPLNLRMVAL